MGVDIDFEDASKEWRKNKVKKPYGWFKYRCHYFIEKNKENCKNVVANHRSSYCKRHQAISNDNG